MRAVVQRSGNSKVICNDLLIGEIERGLVLLLGIKVGDSEKDIDYLMDKIINLRIFADEEGKMNHSLIDIKGEILIVSQFTLYGDVRKGRRPSFTQAALPEQAVYLYNYAINYLNEKGIAVQSGEFGGDMQVFIENDGPCTILLDSEKII